MKKRRIDKKWMQLYNELALSKEAVGITGINYYMYCNKFF